MAEVERLRPLFFTFAGTYLFKKKRHLNENDVSDSYHLGVAPMALKKKTKIFS